MSSITIYLVYGECGNYPSDYQKWVVCAYEHEEQARIHAKEANTEVREMRKRAREQRMSDPPLKMNYDPDCPTTNLDGREYSVESLTLWAHFDVYQEVRGIV